MNTREMILENNCKKLLADFNETTLIPYSPFPLRILKIIHQVMCRDALSARNKINQIIKEVEIYMGKNETPVSSFFMSLYRSVTHSNQEKNFFITYKNYNLKNKMQEIIEQYEREKIDFSNENSASMQMPTQPPLSTWHHDSVIPQPPNVYLNGPFYPSLSPHSPYLLFTSPSPQTYVPYDYYQSKAPGF